MNKPIPGASFPPLRVSDQDGSLVDIGKPSDGSGWRMIVVYRGRHCPMCTKFLNALEHHVDRFREIGVEVVAVSADSHEQFLDHVQGLNVSFPIYHGLTLEQMETLGVHISSPRSANETDHPFSEPGLFVVNQDNQLHMTDISNNPYLRPDLESLLSGLGWLKNPENDYPIRGTCLRS